MSIDCSARLDDRRAAPARGAAATPVAIRVLRALALASALARLWLAAHLRVKRGGEPERRALVQSSARRMLDALAVEVVVRGRASAGRAALLVANHVSWLDSYAIHAVADARFVGKSEIRAWPVIGGIAERFGTLFIVRGSRRDAWRVKNRAAHLLRAGRSVAVFPEGTTTDGGTMRRFFPALFQAAVEARVAVQPVAVRYYGSDGAATTAAAFVDDMSIADSLGRLLSEPRLVVEVVFGAPLEPGADRKSLCRAAESSVRAALALPRHWLIEVAADRGRSRAGNASPGLPVAAGA